MNKDQAKTDAVKGLACWLVFALTALLVITTASGSPAQTSRSAADYFKRASELHAQRNFSAAIADYDIAITFDPRWALAYLGRGNSKYAKGDLDEAIADYDKGIQINPRYAEAYSDRGQARVAKGIWIRPWPISITPSKSTPGSM